MCDCPIRTQRQHLSNPRGNKTGYEENQEDHGAKSQDDYDREAKKEAMAKRKPWTSLGARTPHATLYASILREINSKTKPAVGYIRMSTDKQEDSPTLNRIQARIACE